MRNVFHKGFCLATILLPAILITGQTASADILSGSVSSVTDPASDLPPADLSGWFGNGDPGFLFPMPVDPSQPWTSADNLATISAWQSLVAAAQGDPALLAQLVGMGMNSSSSSQELASMLLAISGQIAATGSSVPSAESIAAPESALLAFPGSGLVLFALIAFARLRPPMAIIGSTCRAMKV